MPLGYQTEITTAARINRMVRYINDSTGNCEASPELDITLHEFSPVPLLFCLERSQITTMDITFCHLLKYFSNMKNKEK